MAHGDGAPQRLTVSNPWLADVELAPQAVFGYQARDGLDLSGVLIRPLEAGQGPAPLLLMVHGGPEAHRRNGWLTGYSTPAQIAAARGYAVYFPNYRGSTGRGVAFSKLGQGDAAGGEFDDLVDAVVDLAEVPTAVLDAAALRRATVIGFSFGGGVALELAQTRPDRVASLGLVATVMPDRPFEPVFMDNLRQVAGVIRSEGVAAAMAGPWASSPLFRHSFTKPGVREAVAAIGTRDVSFIRCAIVHTGGYAMGFGAGCRNVQVEACEMVDLGGGGASRLARRPMAQGTTMGRLARLPVARPPSPGAHRARDRRDRVLLRLRLSHACG